ncbi:hypothetical protein P9112_013147 [Eukaryota sp. TZLM1-RC]
MFKLSLNQAQYLSAFIVNNNSTLSSNEDHSTHPPFLFERGSDFSRLTEYIQSTSPRSSLTVLEDSIIPLNESYYDAFTQLEAKRSTVIESQSAVPFTSSYPNHNPNPIIRQGQTAETPDVGGLFDDFSLIPLHEDTLVTVDQTQSPSLLEIAEKGKPRSVFDAQLMTNRQFVVTLVDRFLKILEVCAFTKVRLLSDTPTTLPNVYLLIDNVFGQKKCSFVVQISLLESYKSFITSIIKIDFLNSSRKRTSTSCKELKRTKTSIEALFDNQIYHKPPPTRCFVTGKGNSVDQINHKPPPTSGFVTGKGNSVDQINHKPPPTSGFVTGKGNSVDQINRKPPPTSGFVTGKGNSVDQINHKPPPTSGFVTGKGNSVDQINQKPPPTSGFVTGKGNSVDQINHKPPPTSGFVTGNGNSVDQINHKPPPTSSFVTGKGNSVDQINHKPPPTSGFVTGKGNSVDQINHKPPPTSGFVTGKGNSVDQINHKPPPTSGFVTGKGNSVDQINHKPPPTSGFVTGKGNSVDQNNRKPPPTSGCVTGKGNSVDQINQKPPPTSGFVTGKGNSVDQINHKPPPTSGFVTGKGNSVDQINHKPPPTSGFVTGKGNSVDQINHKPPPTSGFVTGKGNSVDQINHKPPPTSGFVTGKGNSVDQINHKPPPTSGFVTGKGNSVDQINHKPPPTSGFVTGKGNSVDQINHKPPPTSGFVTGKGNFVDQINQKPPPTSGFVTGKGNSVDQINHKPPPTSGFVSGKGNSVDQINHKPPPTSGFVSGKGNSVDQINHKPPPTSGFVSGKGNFVDQINHKPPPTSGFVTGKGNSVDQINHKPPPTSGFVTGKGNSVDQINQKLSKSLVDTSSPSTKSYHTQYHMESSPNLVDNFSLSQLLTSEPPLKQPRVSDLHIGSLIKENKVSTTNRISLHQLSAFIGPQPLSLSVCSDLNSICSSLLSNCYSFPISIIDRFGPSTTVKQQLAELFGKLDVPSMEFLKFQFGLVLWKLVYKNGILPSGLPTSVQTINNSILALSGTVPWLCCSTLMSTLKYRLYRFSGLGERSVLWKIIEGDFPSNIPMVLQVMYLSEQDDFSMILSDGWAAVKCKTDEFLESKVKNGVIKIGTKLFVSHSVLDKSEDTESLEPNTALGSNAILKINYNSVKPVKWWAKLGFNKHLARVTSRITSIKKLNVSGGIADGVFVIVQRVLPTLYVEFKPIDKDQNLLLFRTSRLEDHVLRKFQDSSTRIIEKLRSETFDELNEFMSSQVRRSEHGDEVAGLFLQNEFQTILKEKLDETDGINRKVLLLSRFLVSDQSTSPMDKWSLLTVWSDVALKTGDCVVVSDVDPSKTMGSSLMTPLLLKATKRSTIIPMTTQPMPLVPIPLVETVDQLKCVGYPCYFDCLLIHIFTKQFEDDNSDSFNVSSVSLFALVSECSPLFVSVTYEVSRKLYLADGQDCFPSFSDVVIIRNLMKTVPISQDSLVFHCLCSDSNEIMSQKTLEKSNPFLMEKAQSFMKSNTFKYFVDVANKKILAHV